MVENKPAEEFTPLTEDSGDTFEAFGLKPDLIRGIYTHLAHSSDKNPLRPYPIQHQAIPMMLAERDLVGRASSGRGKTVTFIISMLQMINTDLQSCQALILTPTRELALQAEKLIISLGEYLKVSAHTVQGGNNMKDDQKRLQEGVHVVVGTPGRMHDMLVKGFIKTEHLKLFVLDETDEILSRGFMDHIKDTFKILPREIQVALFSATMPPEIPDLAKNLMKDPVQVLVPDEINTLPTGVRQFYIKVDNEEKKFDALVELYRRFDTQQIVIYCNLKDTVDQLTLKLSKEGFTASGMHEGKSVEQNESNLKDFRTGASMILVTTDSPCYGIPSIQLKIYYEQSPSEDIYARRLSWPGRFYCRMTIVNIVTPSEYEILQEIEKFYDTQITKLPVDISDIIHCVRR